MLGSGSRFCMQQMEGAFGSGTCSPLTLGQRNSGEEAHRTCRGGPFTLSQPWAGELQHLSSVYG